MKEYKSSLPEDLDLSKIQNVGPMFRCNSLTTLPENIKFNDIESPYEPGKGMIRLGKFIQKF